MTVNPARAGFFVCARIWAFLLCALVTTGIFAQVPNVALDGEHVEVAAIHFTGNASFTEAELLRRIQTIPTPSLFTRVITFWSEPKSYVNGVTVVQDSGALIEWYRDHGFMFATVAYAIAIDTPHTNGVVLFTINEGRRCIVDSIAVTDSARLLPAELAVVQSYLAAIAGKPFLKSALRDSIGSAVNFLQDNGYRFARLAASPVVRLNSSMTGVTVNVIIDPGKKYRFARPEIVYDSTSVGICFSENAVRFELEFNEGDFYSRSKVNRTEDNLRRLGVFEVVRVELVTADVDTATRITPTRLYLKMRRQIDFTFDLIANNDQRTFNIGLTMSLAHHNVFCAAQDLSLSGTYVVPNFTSNFKFDVFAKFFQPHVRLGDILDYRKTSLQMLGGYSRTTYPYHQVKYTASVQLNIRQAAYTYLIPQIAYVQVETDTTGLGADNASRVSSSEIVSKQPNLLVSVSLQRDHTNNLFVPTEGSAGVLTLKANVLNAAQTPVFGKVEGTSKWYVSWGTQSVFAFRVHGGLIGRLTNRDKDILLEEKFYAGGAYSVRGWNLYDLGWGLTDAIKTGYTVAEANAEWRYQVFKLPDSWIARVILNRLSTSFFLDIGQTWGELTMVKWVPDMPKQLAAAIGVGFRYDTPVGPLRFDLGYKLYDPSTGEFPTIASFDNHWPFILVVHPTLQLAIGNAF